MASKYLARFVIVLACLAGPSAVAKNDKSIMPSYVLAAHTVSVIIDPDAGVSLNDPRANEIAQSDVETALQNWGRFTPVRSTQQPDLIIVVRKGQKQWAEETMRQPRPSIGSGGVVPSQGGNSSGSQSRSQPSQAGDDPLAPANSRTQNAPEVEVGRMEDSFLVFDGRTEDAARGHAAWRWIRKEGLRSHDVPAVDEFRKALTEAEKQATKQAAKHP